MQQSYDLWHARKDVDLKGIKALKHNAA